MLTSKQRAYLRGLANPIETILMIGKGEITDNIVKQATMHSRQESLIMAKCLRTAVILQEKLPNLSPKNAVRKLYRLSVQNLFSIKRMRTSLKLFSLRTEENEQNRNTQAVLLTQYTTVTFKWRVQPRCRKTR